MSLKLTLKKTLGMFSLIPSGSRAIFVYHDISNPDSKGYQNAHSTTPANFERQLKFLKEKFQFVTLDELLGSDSQDKLASITFDDGFRSVLDSANPILKKLGIPYTIFLNKCAIEAGTIPYPVGEWRASPSDGLYLSASDLTLLKQEGVCLGSHTMNHKILAACDPVEEEREITENKNFLEKLLGVECKYMAVPFGKKHHTSPRTVSIAQRVGHKKIFSTHPFLTNKTQLDSEQYFVPRIPLLNNDNWEINFFLNRSLLP